MLGSGRSHQETRAPRPDPALEVRSAAPADWCAVLALAWPVIAQQLLILLVSLSDSFLAGHFQPLSPRQQAEIAAHRITAVGLLGGAPSMGGIGGALAAETSWQAANHLAGRHLAYQSAQTTAHYLSWLINSYALLVGVGATALVARFVGAGDQRSAILATNQAILLAIVLGLVGSVLGLAGRDRLVVFLQLQGESLTYASAYLRPLFLLLVFQIVEAAGIACLIGAGDTRTGLYVLASVTVMNLPLAWGFFHGAGPLPALGFEGISLGTALAHVGGACVVLAVLARGRAGLQLRMPLLRPRWDLLRRLLWVSVPAGFDSLSQVACQLWFLSIVNRLGDEAGTAHGIALRWEALGYLFAIGFGTAAMSLVGRNLGARRPNEAARSGWLALAMGCAVMTAMALVFVVLAPQMFLLFCPNPEQRHVVAIGVPVLRLVAFAMPATASWIVFTYALRGAGDTRIPVLFTWCGFLCVRIPLAYLLTQSRVDLGPFGSVPGFGLGLFGAWLAMFADLYVRGSFFLYRFASGRWKRVRV